MYQLKINGDPVAYFRDRHAVKRESRKYPQFNKIEIISL